MAQNRVWRYTLRLFHTFATFEKIEKTMTKYSSKVVFSDPKCDLGRPKDHFAPKSMTIGIPFGIDFSIFFKNCESVK